jgi:predicted TIM-barrel fold metal-dependent hydrolase
MPIEQSRINSWPHPPDVLERETADGGFSKGWGMHFQPVAECIINAHGHIQFALMDHCDKAVEDHLKIVAPMAVSHVVVCSPIASAKTVESSRGMGIYRVCVMEQMEPYLDLADRHSEMSLLLFLDHDNPDPVLVRQCAKRGVRGIKLHNAPLIMGGVCPEHWLDSRWAEVFAEIERLGLPVLWHVTQRLTDSPYTGGARNVYWSDGWKNGATFTNEDLLQTYLQIVETYPGIPFISAHQLHIGWERLDELMEQHQNLFIDTSIGCVVREGDLLYEEDRDYIRSFFISRSDRILFGTDFFITDDDDQDTAYLCQSVGSHIRFLRQLRLPHDVLQRVAHGNAQRLLKIPSEGDGCTNR